METLLPFIQATHTPSARMSEMTSVLEASREGDLDSVKRLIAAGANLEEKDEVSA